MSIPNGGYGELFILSPPHAGTTAMAKLLLSSPRVWSRIGNAEGQKLPESEPFLGKKLWSPKHVADWNGLRSVWEEGRPEGAILLEKSPPIMAHVEALLQTWPCAYFVISMRHPLALVASYLARRGASEHQLREAVTRWIHRSKLQRRNVRRLEGRALVTSYESFAAAPAAFVTALEQVFGPLEVDVARPLEVKRYAPAPISDHNARQIATLSPEHLAQARQLLQIDGARDLSFWGY